MIRTSQEIISMQELEILTTFPVESVASVMSATGKKRISNSMPGSGLLSESGPKSNQANRSSGKSGNDDDSGSKP